MAKTQRQQIAYRCPKCTTANVGFLGGLASISDMLRLRCECGEYALDIKREGEGKFRLNVPCVFCKTYHSYVLSSSILSRETVTRLSCPTSSQDILFIADSDNMQAELDRSADELSRILASFEADEVADIQPEDAPEGDLVDPAIYDVLNFVIRDLEDAGKISCPCGTGDYELRYADWGARVSCKRCEAYYDFFATSAATAELYLDLGEVKLS